jgi:hypothetical protein
MATATSPSGPTFVFRIVVILILLFVLFVLVIFDVDIAGIRGWRRGIFRGRQLPKVRQSCIICSYGTLCDKLV